MSEMINTYVTSLDVKTKESQKKVQHNVVFSLSLSRDAGSASSIAPFYTVVNSTIELFSEAYKEACLLKDPTVKAQTQEAIRVLIENFQNKNTSSKRFPKPSITENEDLSCLLEWNFENFRIGISFEVNESKSFYFFVSRDNSIGATGSMTRRVNSEIGLVTSAIADFVIGNT